VGGIEGFVILLANCAFETPWLSVFSYTSSQALAHSPFLRSENSSTVRSGKR